MRNALYACAMALALAAALPFAQADSDESRGWFKPARQVVTPVDNPLYTKECGGCHVDYAPGLLPTLSWERIMADLDQHFGDNAELDPAVAREVLKYLRENAADRSDSALSRKIMKSLGTKIPVRITQVPYIAREHREIPDRFVKDNPQVKSLSQCGTCHTDVAEGTFREVAIRIPGVGRWED